MAGGVPPRDPSLPHSEHLIHRVDRWYEFLDAMKRTLVTPEGRVIPVLAAIGNHEVRGGYHHNSDAYAPAEAWQREFAPFYNGVFAFPGHPGYGILDFGEYLSIVLLDTDQSGPIDERFREEGAAEPGGRLADVPHGVPHGVPHRAVLSRLSARDRPGKK